MAHQINRMMFVGQAPWHGLGTQLPRNATYEEIVEAAGFYEVEKRELYLPNSAQPVPDQRALVRADTREYLATVGKSYEVVQCADVAKTLVEAADASGVGAIFHTAGTLGERGARFWLLAEVGEPIRVKGDRSEIKPYVLGTSAHDGCSPVVLANVATRVVCMNTLGVALSEHSKFRWTIRHTRSAQDRLREAARAFRELRASFELFGGLANQLATIPFRFHHMEAVLDTVLPVPMDDIEHPRLMANREKVVELFETGRGMDGIRGTAWGALQAVTEFADHHRGTRVRGARDARDQRLESIWLGSAADLKRRGLAAIAEVSGINLMAA